MSHHGSTPRFASQERRLGTTNIRRPTYSSDGTKTTRSARTRAEEQSAHACTHACAHACARTTGSRVVIENLRATSVRMSVTSRAERPFTYRTDVLTMGREMRECPMESPHRDRTNRCREACMGVVVLSMGVRTRHRARRRYSNVKRDNLGFRSDH